MTLTEKVLQLKLQGAVAMRHALWWEKQLAEHGEEKATAFYKHLGLNHIEKKSIDWEGMMLSREPKPHEQIAIKGVANAQDTAKERIATLLLGLRSELISDGLKRIGKLTPAKFHSLVLLPPAGFRLDLKDRLIKTYREGRTLVQHELERQRFKQIEEDDFDELDTLAEVTDARVANDVQARIIAAAARFTLLGLVGKSLIDAIQREIDTGSISYIDRTSTGLANRVINIGRMDEAQSRRDDWERVEYSAILDQNVCEPCAAEDGQEALDENELTPVPNPECLGGDWCRCFHVFIRA